MAKATRRAKRFIVEVYLPGSMVWVRSGNPVINGSFLTKEAAQAALKIYGGSMSRYRIRQK